MLALSLDDTRRRGSARGRAMAAAAGGRFTVVRADGRVMVDSEADAARMENHAHAAGAAAGVRGRAGLGHPAQRHAGGSLSLRGGAMPRGRGAAGRAAMPRSNARWRRSAAGFWSAPRWRFCRPSWLAALLARWISRRFATIMAHAGELARRQLPRAPAGTGGSEFGQLARTLNETAENLQRTVEQLQREHSELEKAGARPQGFRDQRLA